MEETIRKYQQEDLEDSSHFNGQSNFQNNKYDRYYDEQIKNIRLVVPWIIVIFGLFGNILILIIFSKKLRRSISHAFCFIVLAISDSLALIFMVLRALLKTEILNNLNASCKAIKFLYHYFLQTSSWCLVLLTLDRFIAVCFIFKYKNWCKKFHVLKIFISILVLILLINLHLLIYVNAFEKKGEFADGISKLNEKGKPPRPTRSSSTLSMLEKKSYVCNVSISDHPIYFKYIYRNWDTFHAVIYGALPFLLILVANFIIIYKLMKLRKKSAQYLSDGKSSSRSNDDDSMQTYQLTLMLLTVSFTFLVLTSPISLYMAAIYDNLTNVRISKREFIKVILRYLGYVNNGINFYIYFFTSEEFRKDVFILFRCCRSVLPLSKNSSIYTACTTSTSLPDINIETRPIKKSNVSKSKDKSVVFNPIQEEETRELRVSDYEEEKPKRMNNIYRPKTKVIFSKPFEQRVSEYERETLYSQTTPEVLENNRKRIHQVVYDGKKSKHEAELFLPNQNEDSIVTHL